MKHPILNLLAPPVLGGVFVVFLPFAGIVLTFGAVVAHARRALSRGN